LPSEQAGQGAISAPVGSIDQAGLQEKINELRAQGEVVINALSAAVDARCDRNLVFEAGQWQVKEIVQ
jgi:hypothetical protein